MKLPKVSYHQIGFLLLFVYFCWPSRFAMFYYENLGSEEIFDSLIKKTSKNLSMFRDKGIQCVSTAESGLDDEC